MTLRIHKDPVTLRFIFLLVIIGCLAYLEYKLAIEKEVIIISITVISATVGYFITHFLENECKKLEEKIKLYTKLVLGLRIFMRSGEKPQDAIKQFEDTYYAAWIYISTGVYIKLVSYMEQYKVWAADQSEENKTLLNKKLLPLMQAIRDEVTVDQKTEFTNYIIQ